MVIYRPTPSYSGCQVPLHSGRDKPISVIKREQAEADLRKVILDKRI